MKEKQKALIGLITGIIVALVISGFFLILIQQFIEPSYTIQDVHLWCCKNLNATTSPTGDNCSNVINNIYGGEC